MKFFSTILVLFCTSLLFAQEQVTESENFTIQKLDFYKNIENDVFVKTFNISNTENQPFISMSVVLNGIFNKEREVWVRTKSKYWSQWKSLKEDIHLQKKNFSFKNLFFINPDVTKIEIKIIDLNNINNIKVDFFYPGFTKDLIQNKSNTLEVSAAPPPVNCSCPIPLYQARIDWCPSGNCPSQQNPTITTVTHLIVHHSAGPNTSSDWAARVRSIWNYHVNSNGWADIGYNYIIDPNGVIYEGRGNNVLGAHFSGMNSGTMGVCLLGDYQPSSGNGTPSAAMISSLEKLLSWKECDISKDPLLSSYHANSSLNLMHIAGHRDSGSGTECPGDNVYDILPNIRNACSSYMQNCSFVANADLVVSSINTNPSSIFLNQNTTINIAVGNGGNADVTDTIKVVLTINSDTIQTFTFDTLFANDILYFSFSNYQFSSLGNHSICVYISNASNETNTLNNSYCKTILVQNEEELTSNIIIQSILSTPTIPEVLENVNIVFKVKNIGDTSTLMPVQAKIKIDGSIKEIFTVNTLLSNEVYTRNYAYQFTESGNHEACILVNSPTNEENSLNNSYCKTIVVKDTLETTPNPISKISFINKLEIFPNPSRNYITINVDLKKKSNLILVLYNHLGQDIYTFMDNKKSKNHLHKIQLRNYSKGVYFLKISLNTNTIKKKIIIQ